jgi:hypothetical protein
MIDGVSLTESSTWRQRATAALRESGFETYDPTAVMQGVTSYKPSPREVFTNDTYYLRRSDVVLANLTLPETIESQKAPFFTIGELFLAHQAGLPIIVFGNCFQGRAGYEAIVTKTYARMDDAVAYIAKHY